MSESTLLPGLMCMRTKGSETVWPLAATYAPYSVTKGRREPSMQTGVNKPRRRRGRRCCVGRRSPIWVRILRELFPRWRNAEGPQTHPHGGEALRVQRLREEVQPQTPAGDTLPCPHRWDQSSTNLILLTWHAMFTANYSANKYFWLCLKKKKKKKKAYVHHLV